MWLLLRLPSGMITITNYYPHKRGCQGHPFLLFIVGEMYLKFHRSWNKQGPLNSSSCPSKHFVKVYTVLTQVTRCEFTQRLLHSASGNINHFKEDINDTILIEVITIVLMWTCSSVLNLLNSMPGQMWNWRFYLPGFFFQPCTYISPGFHMSAHKTVPCMVILFVHQDGETRMLQ